MEMLHVLQQKKTKVTDRMKELWALKDKEGKSWTREQSEEYSRLETDASALEKELKQRIEYQRIVQSNKSVDEKRFERETKGIGIHSLLRSLIYKQTGDSDFKEDTGKVSEFTRESELSEGGVRDKPPGALAIPGRALMHTFKRALTTADASGGEAIQDYTETQPWMFCMPELF